jgi:hypothetical protein
MIPKCEHGVYSPEGDGKPSAYCSGCTTPGVPLCPPQPNKYEQRQAGGYWITDADNCKIWIVGLIEPIAEAEESEVLTVDCPRCFAAIKVYDEYDLECSHCGYNGLEGDSF